MPKNDTSRYVARKTTKKTARPSLLRIIGIAAVITAAIAGAVTPLRGLLHHPEPLADEASLRALTHGMTLPQPADEPAAVYLNTPVSVPPTTFAHVARILGLTTNSSAQKRIEVDLTRQKVYAYEDNLKVFEFTVSTGKWGWTPTGEFTIWAKVKSQLMKGGSREKGTYYYLPNVPWVMFFYNDKIPKMRGFSFHGTYWHDKFGTPQSHGCINMKTEEAKMLYDWATPVVTNDKAWSTLAGENNPGTTVVIYGETPKS